MSNLTTHGVRVTKLTPDQENKLRIARVAFMTVCPFYSHLYYSIGKEVITKDLPTAATDGRHIFINPDYFCRFPVPKQVFILAHEMSHLVWHHAQRFQYYQKQDNLRGLPWSKEFANVCADYVINADLVDTLLPDAQIDRSWLYDPSIKGSELWEDVYERLFKQSQQRQQPHQPKTAGDAGKGDQRGKADGYAEGNGGLFDEVMPTPVDPITGEPDLPGENEFKEAIARAAAVAKSMGNMPANWQRMVDELLQPQVDWRDHIRLLMTGKIGQRAETWTRPNRRRLVLNPLVIVPGRKGYGAETVVVAVDTSGSIGQKELDVFLAEVGGILNDVKPRRIMVIGCDAAVSQVDEVRSLDEFEGLRQKGIKGGGGTRFEPVFDYCDEHDLRPETLVYLTDLYGSFPAEAPGYPVVWAATTDQKVPWGDVVRIDVP